MDLWLAVVVKEGKLIILNQMTDLFSLAMRSIRAIFIEAGKLSLVKFN